MAYSKHEHTTGGGEAVTAVGNSEELSLESLRLCLSNSHWTKLQKKNKISNLNVHQDFNEFRKEFKQLCTK
jgi:hypothetical protein